MYVSVAPVFALSLISWLALLAYIRIVSPALLLT